MASHFHLVYRIVRAPTPPPAPGTFEAAIGVRLRAILRRLVSRIWRRQVNALDRGAATPTWRALDERLDGRFALPYAMVTAPRWNTHARILTAGPFRHTGGSLRFEGPAGRNWEAWSLVIYDAATGDTVDFLSSGTHAREIELPIGTYRVGLRVYEPDAAINLPELTAASSIVPARTVEARPRDALERRIFGTTSPFYRLLNASVMRRLAKAEDGEDDSLAADFLPVGNPETLFLFGPVSQGSIITVGTEAIPREVRCYLTVYNTASFPVASVPVPLEERTLHRCTEHGSFLIRMVPGRGGAEGNAHLLDMITVRVDDA